MDKKVILISIDGMRPDGLKICKNNFDLSFPVFVDKEEIKILSKTLLVFAFVFLLSLFSCDIESLSSAKIACDAIDDFDIIQVVDFSRRVWLAYRPCIV